MTKSKLRNLLIISLFLLCLVSMMPIQVNSAVKITEPQIIQLSNNEKDTFDVGCVRTPWDQYNISADSENQSTYEIFTHNLGSDNIYNTPMDEFYPQDLGEIDGTNIWNPSTNTKWIAKYNNSNKFGSADISIKKSQETLAAGERKTIIIEPTTSILDIYTSLSAHTAYMLVVRQVGGNTITLTTFLGANVILDPLGDQITTANQWINAITGIGAVSIFVAGATGPHLISIDYLGIVTAQCTLELELRAIPETPVTSGVTTAKGDAVDITTEQAFALPPFQVEAFTMSVSIGEGFDCELAQVASIVNGPFYNTILTYFPQPSSTGWYSYQGSSNTQTTGILSSNLASGTGKIFFITLDTQAGMHYVTMNKYPIVGQAIDTTINHDIDPYGMKTVCFGIGTQSIIWINGSNHSPNSAAMMWNLRQLLPTGILRSLIGETNLAATVMAGNYSIYHILEPGTYYLPLDNTAGNEMAWINLQIKQWNSHINGTHDLWEDNFTSPNWAGFNSGSDYYSIDFIDNGRGMGNKIPKVIPFTITQMTYIQARFNFTIAQNQAFNTTSTWKLTFQYVLVGPQGYYSTNYLTNYASNANTWNNFNNVSVLSQFSLATTRLILPGTYKLFMLVDNVWNTTGVDTVYNGNVTFNVRIMNMSNHYAWIDYEMSDEEPLYHAYSQAAGFRSVKYLDFTDPTNTYYHLDNYTYCTTTLDGDRYDNGVLIHIKGATPYSWTQLLLYLNDSAISTFTVIYPNGFWNKFYQSFQTSAYPWAGLNAIFGHYNTGGANDTYSREFGVFASEYYIFFNPANNPLLLGIEIREYDTPLLQQINLLSPPTTPVDLTGVVVVVVVLVIVFVAVGAAAAIVIYRRRRL